MFSFVMVEYLLLSGTKCLDFQVNNKQNRKSGTPVAVVNSSLSQAADPPPPFFEDILSTPTEDLVMDFVSVSNIDHSETLLTVVVNNSTGGPGGWFGL